MVLVPVTVKVEVLTSPAEGEVEVVLRPFGKRVPDAPTFGPNSPIAFAIPFNPPEIEPTEIATPIANTIASVAIMIDIFLSFIIFRCLTNKCCD